MKAITYYNYGGPDQFKLEEIIEPFPKNDEVLVQVQASSINSWDYDLLLGKQFLTRMLGGFTKPGNKILGADIAGRVIAKGKYVSAFQIGDEVYGDIANCGFGGFAEYVSVPEKWLAKKTPSITFEQAASIPQAGLLAIQGLRHGGDITPGQRVLINGAGGGVGTLALQYAKKRGAEVTCVERPEKFQVLTSLGANELIDYTKGDYTLTGLKYDRILDVTAHRTITDYRRVLNPGGAFVMIGGSMGGLLLKMMVVAPVISKLGNRTVGLMGYKPSRGALDELSGMLEDGTIKPVIDSIYSLEEVPLAFQRFGTGLMEGKIVIRVSGE